MYSWLRWDHKNAYVLRTLQPFLAVIVNWRGSVVASRFGGWAPNSELAFRVFLVAEKKQVIEINEYMKQRRIANPELFRVPLSPLRQHPEHRRHPNGVRVGVFFHCGNECRSSWTKLRHQCRGSLAAKKIYNPLKFIYIFCDDSHGTPTPSEFGHRRCASARNIAAICPASGLGSSSIAAMKS